MKDIKKEIDATILYYKNKIDSYNRPARFLYLNAEDMRLFKQQLVSEYGRIISARGAINLLENRFDYRGLKVIESDTLVSGEILVSAILKEKLININTMHYYEEEML